MKPPCQNCPDRQILCHSTCEKYLKYKRAREAASDNRHQRAMLERYHYDITARADKLRRMHA